MKGLCKIICDANPKLAEMVVDKKERTNLNGTVCSYFLQEKEVIILEQIFKYCISNGYVKNNECVLCADGIMVRKCFYKVELLKELEDVIYSTTGFRVNMSNKAMDLGYNAILDKHTNFNLYGPTFTSGLLADHFQLVYSNLFIVVNNVLYCYNGVVWVRDSSKNNSVLHSFVDVTYYKYLTKYINGARRVLEQNIQASKDTDEIDALNDKMKPMDVFLTNINFHLRNASKQKI